MARSKRDQWSRDVVKAKGVASSTRLFLASVLTRHMRPNGHVSRPREALAEEMGCGLRTIDRHFSRAIDGGWLAQTRPGYLGHTAEFEATWPNEISWSMSDKSGAHMSDKSKRAYARQKWRAIGSSTTTGLVALDCVDVDSAHLRDVLALEMESSRSKSNRCSRNHLRAVTA